MRFSCPLTLFWSIVYKDVYEWCQCAVCIQLYIYFKNIFNGHIICVNRSAHLLNRKIELMMAHCLSPFVDCLWYKIIYNHCRHHDGHLSFGSFRTTTKNRKNVYFNNNWYSQFRLEFHFDHFCNAFIFYLFTIWKK